MLKSKKSKIIIGAVGILAVLITTSICVTSIFKKTDVDAFDYTTLANAEPDSSTTLTQIDHIIQEADPYNVLIITSGSTDTSTVKDFLERENDGFTKYIINDNRTIEDELADGKVNVTVKAASDYSSYASKSAIADTLSDVDLIFLYGQSSNSFTGGEGISEDLYECLHNYISAGKPMILSYYGITTGGSDDVIVTTSTGYDSNVWAMTTKDFKNSWKRTRTTNVADWVVDTQSGSGDTQVQGILKAYIGSNRSTYVRYSVNDNTKPAGYASWQDYWSRAGEDAKLNVLYIYGDTLSSEVDDIQAVADWMVSDGKDSAFNTINSYIPGWDGSKGAAEVTAVCASDLTLYDADNPKNSLYVDATCTVKRYDYIFIAPDTYSPASDMQADVVTELEKISAMTDSYTYIMFGTLVGKTVSSNTTTSSTSSSFQIDTTTNYGKLVDLCVTTTGYAKKSNVLPVGVSYMNKVSEKPDYNPTKISQIVSLINKSTYKTYAGSGSGGDSGSTSTTAFRVLELQPCYPIDLEMALSSSVKTNLNSRNGYNGSGNYYTIPANVINTSDIDSIADSETGAITTEYYQWDLSMAKLAYALNMSVDQIELVQMSTEEFITSKTDVSDAYDLIYIGGNSSALQPIGSYNYWPNWGINSATVSNTTAFSMYSHTGEISGMINKWTSDYSVTTLNGNDITYDRMEALEEYIDSGLPVVFSNELWKGYTEAKSKGYSNLYIDPDSNMYAVLAYAEGKSNVMTSWEIKTEGSSSNNLLSHYWKSSDTQVQRIDNTEGKYGSASKVTVFNDDLSDELYGLVYSSSSMGYSTKVRPRYTIKTNAVEYSDSDSSTKLTTHDLTWEITILNSVAGRNYMAILMEDTDDNAEFSLTKEKLATTTFSGDTATLSYSYPSDDYGAFSWKIVVADVTDTKTIKEESPSRSYSSISMIARSDDQPKKSATILEIMPLTVDKVGGNDGQDGHTLYLDSAYQQARGSKFLYSTYVDNAFMDENGDIASGYYKSGETYNGYNVIDPSKTPSISGYSPAAKSLNSDTYWSSKDINFKENGGNYQGTIYMGMYLPTLSLNRFDSDSSTYHEDWTYNYVDLIKDDYDLTLDIMYMDDIQYYSEQTRKTTDEEKANYASAAETQKAVYDSYNTEGTVNYNNLKKAEDHMIEVLRTLQQGGSLSYTCMDGTTKGTYAASKYDLYDVDGIISTKQYYRFFYMNQSLYYGANWCDAAAAFYFDAYLPYITEYDKMVNAYRRYRHYSMLAYGPEEYLRANYDVIVIGFYDEARQDMVDFSANACSDLQEYLDADGSLLMTHDNMTKSLTSAVNLTSTLRSYAGMERFGEITTQSGTEDSAYPHYLTTDSKKYFFTNLSTNYDLSKNVSANDASWNSKVTSWINARGSLGGWGSSFGYPGYTDAFVIYETNQAQSLPYSFAEFQIQQQIAYNLNYTAYNITGTTKAVQVNRGVVTTYPFYVDSNLRVSPTHNQAYSLDLEDDQVTVWYTFAADSMSGNGTSGGSNYQTLKENSSLYAASPKDGMDSYFIYSYNNITYCGAGHSQVTGESRDNNDERKLFLNVLVNMASKSGKTTTLEDDIILYDPDGVTEAPGEVVKKSATDGYYINVTSGISYPEFAFSVRMKNGEEVTGVEVFYDLDFDGTASDTQNQYSEDDKHFKVVLPATIIQSLNDGDTFILTKENCPTLITQRSYFDAYDGTYTYLVVRVTVKDKSGNEQVLTKRIKVKISKELLDLT